MTVETRLFSRETFLRACKNNPHFYNNQHPTYLLFPDGDLSHLDHQRYAVSLTDFETRLLSDLTPFDLVCFLECTSDLDSKRYADSRYKNFS